MLQQLSHPGAPNVEVWFKIPILRHSQICLFVFSARGSECTWEADDCSSQGERNWSHIAVTLLTPSSTASMLPDSLVKSSTLTPIVQSSLVVLHCPRMNYLFRSVWTAWHFLWITLSFFSITGSGCILSRTEGDWLRGIWFFSHCKAPL